MLETWAPELQQLHAVQRRGAWSPYQHRCSSEENYGHEVHHELTKPLATLAGPRTSYAWRGTEIGENYSPGGDWPGTRQGDVYTAEGEWRGSGQWASRSPVGVQRTGTTHDGVRPAVVPMNLGSTYDERLSQLPRALIAPLRSVTEAPIVGTPTQTINHRKRRMRTGTWTDSQLATAVAAVDAGSKIAAAARDAGIPQSSLRDHLYGRTLKRKKGRQGVLNEEEESALVKWMLEMEDHVHPISIFELRRKVAEITQERWTPFKDGIPGRGWLRWFRNRHPELTLRSPQGLEEGRARGVNPSSVTSFYDNLQKAYEQHEYSPSHIWNADESGAQVGRNGGGTLVFAQRGSKSVHTIIPNSKEHLTVLLCVNAIGDHVPNFYIFKRKRKSRNYIIRCEPEAVFAMQQNGWMIAFLFLTWISRFLSIIGERYGISEENRHLLVLDGHGSHVTLEVVQKAKSAGLDIITLPSHTSHRLQPLDVSIFKPFKVAFRACRDRWTMGNKGRVARKEELVEWVAEGLKRALTSMKIQKGFAATRIWPLQPIAMDKYMAPSSCYIDPCEENIEDEHDDVEEDAIPDIAEVQEECIPETAPTELEHIPKSQPVDRQFFVQLESDCDLSSDSNTHSEPNGEETNTQRNLFSLPQVQSRGHRGSQVEQPLIDYLKSILMTSNEYIAAMTAKATRKKAVAREREERKIQVEQKKAQREQEKARKEANKLMRQIQAERKKADQECGADEEGGRACTQSCRGRGQKTRTKHWCGAIQRSG